MWIRPKHGEKRASGSAARWRNRDAPARRWSPIYRCGIVPEAARRVFQRKKITALKSSAAGGTWGGKSSTSMRAFHRGKMRFPAALRSCDVVFQRVPRRAGFGGLFFGRGAGGVAAGKEKFTAGNFFLTVMQLSLETPTDCGVIGFRAQDSVVVHRVIPACSPLIGRVPAHFSPRYSQCHLSLPI